MGKEKRYRLLRVGGLVLLICCLLSCVAVGWADSVGSKALSDPAEIYKTYKSSTFSLMTSGTDDLGKIAQAVTSISTAFKEGVWAFVRMVGSFNAEMVKLLFTLDIIKTIKDPVITITSHLASSLLSVGSTVGMCAVALIMIVRFVSTNQLKSALRVFVTTLILFTGLVILSDSHLNDRHGDQPGLVDQVFQIDDAVNGAIVNVNPIFDNTIDTGNDDQHPETHIQKAGDAIAASIFYADVYEPYLLMNYGTSDQHAIRSKGSVDIGKATKQDRIDGPLDHENMSSKDWDALVKKESDTFKNNTINYKNNWLQGIFGIFYILTNLLQTAVFFLLGLMRIVMSLIEILLLPALPILLILALFQVLKNVWGNYAKAFGIAMASKGALGFALIFFASYISLGFTIASKNTDTWQKLVTIIVYVLSPVGVYVFRHIFIATLTGKLSFQDIPGIITHPVKQGNQLHEKSVEQAKQKARQRAKAMNEEKERQKEEMDQKQQDGKMLDFRQAFNKKKKSRNRTDFESPVPDTSVMESDSTNDPQNDQKDTEKAGNKVVPMVGKFKKGLEEARRKSEKETVDPTNSKDKSEKEAESGIPTVDKDQTVKPERNTELEANPSKADSTEELTQKEDENATLVPIRHARKSRVEKQEAKEAEKAKGHYRRPRADEETPHDPEQSQELSDAESESKSAEEGIQKNGRNVLYRRSIKREEGVSENESKAKITPRHKQNGPKITPIKGSDTSEKESVPDRTVTPGPTGSSDELLAQRGTANPSTIKRQDAGSTRTNAQSGGAPASPEPKQVIRPVGARALITPAKRTPAVPVAAASEASVPLFEPTTPTVSTSVAPSSPPLSSTEPLGPVGRQTRRVALPNLATAGLTVRKERKPKIRSKRATKPLEVRKPAVTKQHVQQPKFPQIRKR